MKKLPVWLIATLTVLVLSGIGVLVWLSIKRQERRDRLYEAALMAVRDDIGAEDTTEGKLEKALLTASCDGKYDAAADAQVLIDARGSWSWTGVTPDDDEAIFAVLRGKTKAQMACIDKALNAQHGLSLSEYIEEVYGDAWDGDNKEKANRIIDTALKS